MPLSLPLLAAWYIPVLLVLAALGLGRRFRVRWAWVLAALLAYTLYVAVGHATLPDDLAVPEARWSSRLAQMACTLAMIGLAIATWRWRAKEPVNLGLTWRQNRGSWPWIAAGLIILVILGALPGGVTTGQVPQPLPLLYHLTLPGLEEELLYRGLLTALFAAALDGRGALAWGAGLASLLFALAHAFAPGPAGAVTFNLAMLLLTGPAGAVLAVMRIRSGSLLFPALGHNLLGVALRYL